MRVLNFSDGFSSNSEPNLGTISANNLYKFTSDAAFVSYKGISAAEGDLYFNTILKHVRWFDGTSWVSGLFQDESGNVIIVGNLTVMGTTTTIDTENLSVTDQNITINKGGNDLTANGSGLTVERESTHGSIVYDSNLTSKWKVGNVGSEKEVVTVDGAQGISNKDIDGGTASNTSRLTIPKGTKSALDTLDRKQGTIVFATDKSKAYVDDGATLKEIGSGIIVVADLTIRDAIPADDRFEGMIVFVQSEAMNFQLIGGILNANWEKLSSGGGVLVVADVTARDAIASDDRYSGLVVFVVSESENYQLVGGITNSHWKYLNRSFRPSEFTTAERDLLAYIKGQIIQNGTTNKLEVNQNTGRWAPLVTRSYSEELSIANGGQIGVTNFDMDTTVLVKAATTAGATLSATNPFLVTGTLLSGTRVTLIGADDSYPVTIPHNTTAGSVRGYTVTLGLGQTAVYEWNATLNQFILISTSN